MKTPLIVFILINFFISCVIGPIPVQADDELRLPLPGMMVRLSPPLNPPILRGIKVDPNNPFKFDFILDIGDRHPEPKAKDLKSSLDSSSSAQNDRKVEAYKLIKYFLASLTVPDNDLWVNLSPYEKNRVIPQSFGLTEMGRNLLAEDYMLKQITASLIYPEDAIGKKFWKRIYEHAAKRYGTTNIAVNTFNKVWIVPDKAVVYENAKEGTAYVVDSRLKVMLEQDYLSLSKHQNEPENINDLGSQVIREIVIPELTREVNDDKNFSQLRQIYSSLILATWYKNKIKNSILEQVYADKKKIKGTEYQDKTNVEFIYQRYLQAFKKGVFNYIKEDIDPSTQEAIPRKYFSGGFDLKLRMDKSMLVTQDPRAMTGILFMAASEPARFERIKAGLVEWGVGLSKLTIIPKQKRRLSALEIQANILSDNHDWLSEPQAKKILILTSAASTSVTHFGSDARILRELLKNIFTAQKLSIARAFLSLAYEIPANPSPENVSLMQAMNEAIGKLVKNINEEMTPNNFNMELNKILKQYTLSDGHSLIFYSPAQNERYKIQLSKISLDLAVLGDSQENQQDTQRLSSEVVDDIDEAMKAWANPFSFITKSFANKNDFDEVQDVIDEVSFVENTYLNYLKALIKANHPQEIINLMEALDFNYQQFLSRVNKYLQSSVLTNTEIQRIFDAYVKELEISHQSIMELLSVYADQNWPGGSQFFTIENLRNHAQAQRVWKKWGQDNQWPSLIFLKNQYEESRLGAKRQSNLDEQSERYEKLNNTLLDLLKDTLRQRRDQLDHRFETAVFVQPVMAKAAIDQKELKEEDRLTEDELKYFLFSFPYRPGQFKQMNLGENPLVKEAENDNLYVSIREGIVSQKQLEELCKIVSHAFAKDFKKVRINQGIRQGFSFSVMISLMAGLIGVGGDIIHQPNLEQNKPDQNPGISHIPSPEVSSESKKDLSDKEISNIFNFTNQVPVLIEVNSNELNQVRDLENKLNQQLEQLNITNADNNEQISQINTNIIKNSDQITKDAKDLPEKKAVKPSALPDQWQEVTTATNSVSVKSTNQVHEQNHTRVSSTGETSQSGQVAQGLSLNQIADSTFVTVAHVNEPHLSTFEPSKMNLITGKYFGNPSNWQPWRFSSDHQTNEFLILHYTGEPIITGIVPTGYKIVGIETEHPTALIGVEHDQDNQSWRIILADNKDPGQIKEDVAPASSDELGPVRPLQFVDDKGKILSYEEINGIVKKAWPAFLYDFVQAHVNDSLDMRQNYIHFLTSQGLFFYTKNPRLSGHYSATNSMPYVISHTLAGTCSTVGTFYALLSIEFKIPVAIELGYLAKTPVVTTAEEHFYDLSTDGHRTILDPGAMGIWGKISGLDSKDPRRITSKDWADDYDFDQHTWYPSQEKRLELILKNINNAIEKNAVEDKIKDTENQEQDLLSNAKEQNYLAILNHESQELDQLKEDPMKGARAQEMKNNYLNANFNAWQSPEQAMAGMHLLNQTGNLLRERHIITIQEQIDLRNRVKTYTDSKGWDLDELKEPLPKPLVIQFQADPSETNFEASVVTSFYTTRKGDHTFMNNELADLGSENSTNKNVITPGMRLIDFNSNVTLFENDRETNKSRYEFDLDNTNSVRLLRMFGQFNRLNLSTNFSIRLLNFPLPDPNWLAMITISQTNSSFPIKTLFGPTAEDLGLSMNMNMTDTKVDMINGDLLVMYYDKARKAYFYAGPWAQKNGLANKAFEYEEMPTILSNGKCVLFALEKAGSWRFYGDGVSESLKSELFLSAASHKIQDLKNGKWARVIEGGLIVGSDDFMIDYQARLRQFHIDYKDVIEITDPVMLGNELVMKLTVNTGLDQEKEVWTVGNDLWNKFHLGYAGNNRINRIKWVKSDGTTWIARVEFNPVQAANAQSVPTNEGFISNLSQQDENSLNSLSDVKDIKIIGYKWYAWGSSNLPNQLDDLLLSGFHELGSSNYDEIKLAKSIEEPVFLKTDGKENPGLYIIIYSRIDGYKAFGPIADQLGITGQEYFQLRAENLENGDVRLIFKKTEHSPEEWMTYFPQHNFSDRSMALSGVFPGEGEDDFGVLRGRLILQWENLDAFLNANTEQLNRGLNDFETTLRNFNNSPDSSVGVDQERALIQAAHLYEDLIDYMEQNKVNRYYSSSITEDILRRNIDMIAKLMMYRSLVSDEIQFGRELTELNQALSNYGLKHFMGDFVVDLFKEFDHYAALGQDKKHLVQKRREILRNILTDLWPEILASYDENLRKGLASPLVAAYRSPLLVKSTTYRLNNYNKLIYDLLGPVEKHALENYDQKLAVLLNAGSKLLDIPFQQIEISPVVPLDYIRERLGVSFPFDIEEEHNWDPFYLFARLFMSDPTILKCVSPDTRARFQAWQEFNRKLSRAFPKGNGCIPQASFSFENFLTSISHDIEAQLSLLGILYYFLGTKLSDKKRQKGKIYYKSSRYKRIWKKTGIDGKNYGGQKGLESLIWDILSEGVTPDRARSLERLRSKRSKKDNLMIDAILTFPGMAPEDAVISKKRRLVCLIPFIGLYVGLYAVTPSGFKKWTQTQAKLEAAFNNLKPGVSLDSFLNTIQAIVRPIPVAASVNTAQQKFAPSYQVFQGLLDQITDLDRVAKALPIKLKRFSNLPNGNVTKGRVADGMDSSSSHPGNNDARSMDWNATARMNEPMEKDFPLTREQPCSVVIDLENLIYHHQETAEGLVNSLVIISEQSLDLKNVFLLMPDGSIQNIGLPNNHGRIRRALANMIISIIEKNFNSWASNMSGMQQGFDYYGPRQRSMYAQIQQLGMGTKEVKLSKAIAKQLWGQNVFLSGFGRTQEAQLNRQLKGKSDLYAITLKKIKLVTDVAMTIEEKRRSTGGIDLTPANMNIQIKTGSPTSLSRDSRPWAEAFGDDKAILSQNGKGIKFHLDSAMLRQLQNAPGFTPIIINIEPMADLRQFLGLSQDNSIAHNG